MQQDDRLINQAWPPCLRFQPRRERGRVTPRFDSAAFTMSHFCAFWARPLKQELPATLLSTTFDSRCGFVHSSVSGTNDINDI